jgi:hypothetical protein
MVDKAGRAWEHIRRDMAGTQSNILQGAPAPWFARPWVWLPAMRPGLRV